MVTPSTSPKPEAPSEDMLLPSFEEDPDVKMASEENIDNTNRPSNTHTMNLDGPTDDLRDQAARIANIADIESQLAAHPVPLRKDISLREFMNRMDDYAPIIPDAVTAHALTLAGLPPPPLSATTTTTKGGDKAQDPNATPLHLSRLLALATQKFVADIAADAYQYSRMRSGNLTSNTLSAMSNPGAAMMAGMPGQTSGAGGAAAAAAAAAEGAGQKQTDKGKQAGQHVLGLQRPGYGGGGQGGGQNRTVLTMEDLGMSAGEYGVNVKRSEFYR